MGQKVHPFGFRLGVYENWKSRWFAKGASAYGHGVLEDIKIRQFLLKRLNRIDIADIVIEKAVDDVRIAIFSSRPGVIIGKKGQGIEHVKVELSKMIKKNVDISVKEVRVPELSARLVAQSIAEQLERRGSYKRLMKRAGYSTMKSGAKGIKICCAGRLAGAEIARTEWLRLGSIPLHTLRAHIDFALAEAVTTYGTIGVKVWICKGEY
ncbi:MAG: 30S ribosomal protein S3 [bacterium]